MTGARAHVVRAVVALLWIAATLGLIALGSWQIQRRAWKLDLIARVDAGQKAAPVPAPLAAGPNDIYRRVGVSGIFLAGKDSLVQASTIYGPGWWVMTPLRTDGGRTILVNRGYVPNRKPVAITPRRVTVSGLLRLSEPGGGFLRANDPAADRWYSRDVAAIAARRGVSGALPYFIDRDAAANAPGRPVGGLTIISFPNNHLVYAVTWFTLAFMSASGFVYWITTARRAGDRAA